jgi:hypothetical protein
MIFDKIEKHIIRLEREKTKRKKDEFDNRLYHSNIIQKFYDQISELEKRIEILERR